MVKWYWLLVVGWLSGAIGIFIAAACAVSKNNSEL